jgi:hypothetical protein
LVTGLSSDAGAEAAMRSLTDDRLKQTIHVVATMLKMLKAEAMRRGVWDDLRGLKP